MDGLTILCITLGEPYAEPFVREMSNLAEQLGFGLVVAADGKPAWELPAAIDLPSHGGPMESVLDAAVNACPDGYILRLDDDERCSAEMVGWLGRKAYEFSEHWAFPRHNLWPDAEHYIENPPLWPDLQTRLSLKRFSGGRPEPHQGSPYGTGTVAECAIEHHKFLVRPREEREASVERQNGWEAGLGDHYAMFSVPERWEDDLCVKPV